MSLLLPLLLCGLHIPPILFAVFQREQNQRHQPTLASRPLMSSAASPDFSPHPPSQVSSFLLFFLLFRFFSGVPSVDAPGLFACISDTVPSAKRARSAYIYIYICPPRHSASIWVLFGHLSPGASPLPHFLKLGRERSVREPSVPRRPCATLRTVSEGLDRVGGYRRLHRSVSRACARE